MVVVDVVDGEIEVGVVVVVQVGVRSNSSGRDTFRTKAKIYFNT